jgi:ectoine hydroxylase-related dioxygenase (phytanoyl-CoA dioxygenase family)
MSQTATDFEYRQKTFALDDVAGMKEAMDEDGFALIPGVLNADEVRETRKHIDGLRQIHWDRMGSTNEHWKNVFNQDPFFLQFVDRAGVVDLAEATMGEQAHIIGESAWRSHKGHNGHGIHVDELTMEIPEEILTSGKMKLGYYLCTAHYYLSDITDETKCPTTIIRGSHKSGRRPKPGEEIWNGRELEPVLCKAGDVLFFRCEIWHSGSLNESDQTRYLLQVHYGHRNTAQHFSPFLDWQFNPEVLKIANPRQRRLLGDHKQMAYD